MKRCDLCHEQPASMEVKRVVASEGQTLAVCAACAEIYGLAAPLDLAAMLLGEASGRSKGLRPECRSCPQCGLTESEIQKSARPGCPCCYEIFADLMEPILWEWHRATQYSGSSPPPLVLDEEALQQALRAALAAEDFEQAAVLRDRLRKLAHEDNDGQKELPFHAYR